MTTTTTDGSRDSLSYVCIFFPFNLLLLFLFCFLSLLSVSFFFFFSNLCVVGEQEEKKKTRNESIISSFKCASLICIASGKSDFKNCVTACIPAKDWATQPKVVKRSHETREDKKIKKKTPQNYLRFDLKSKENLLIINNQEI